MDEGGDAAGPILIGYDGSGPAKAAIAHAAAELGTPRKATVLTVWEPFAAVGFGRVPTPHHGTAPQEGYEELDGNIERGAEGVAAEGVELASDAGFEAESLVVRGSPIWTKIGAAADELDASLIVLGTRGRSGLKAAIVGSVATAVAQHAGRPVLLVPDEQDGD